MRTLQPKILWIIVLLAAITLVACDKKEASSTETASTSAASATQTTAAPAGDEVRPIIPRSEIESEIIGEFTGEVDGNPFQVYVLVSEIEGMDEPLASASWSPISGGYRADILGYRDSQSDRRGLITLHVFLDDDLQFNAEESYAYYYESAADVFLLPDGSLADVEAEWTAEGVMAISGLFAGVGTEEFTDNTREITNGTFTVTGIQISTLY